MDLSPLARWFFETKRSLPWRESPTPYQVLISEVMLQQTQVSVVIDYFERWMKEFPTLKDLAEASTEKVIKVWEGLGYYSRARRLHEAAKEIEKCYGGRIPCTEKELLSIKGIGPYTAGAILSFAFHQKKAAVDGNVLRVFSRLFLIQKEIESLDVKREISIKVEQHLPDNKPWEIMEAFIELGALVCKKKPLCHKCPLKKGCGAFLQGMQDKLPLKRQRDKTVKLQRQVFVIEFEGFFLLKKEEKGLMQGLYEFPYSDLSENLDNLPELLSINFSKKLAFKPFGSLVNQSFTKYQVRLYPMYSIVYERPLIEGHTWVSKQQLSSLPFSSGHRKILAYLLASS